MEESPLIKMINEKFKCISHITDISALSKEDRIKYDETIKIYRDNLAVMSFAETNGREKGKAEENKRARPVTIERRRVKVNMAFSRTRCDKGNKKFDSILGASADISLSLRGYEVTQLNGLGLSCAFWVFNTLAQKFRLF